MEAHRRIFDFDNIKCIMIRKYIPRLKLDKEWVWNADELVCNELTKKNENDLQKQFPEAFEYRIRSIHNKPLNTIELRKLKLEKLLS